MIRKATMALAATLVLGSATLALADGYEDQAADAIRNYGPAVSQPLTTRHIALPQAQHNGFNGFSVEKTWMDRASQNIDGGGN